MVGGRGMGGRRAIGGKCPSGGVGGGLGPSPSGEGGTAQTKTIGVRRIGRVRNLLRRDATARDGWEVAANPARYAVQYGKTTRSRAAIPIHKLAVKHLVCLAPCGGGAERKNLFPRVPLLERRLTPPPRALQAAPGNDGLPPTQPPLGTPQQPMCDGSNPLSHPASGMARHSKPQAGVRTASGSHS